MALAGCSFVTGTIHTQGDIADAGFTDVTISYHTAGSFTTVTVTAGRSPTQGTSLGAQSKSVASVVWQNLPGSFNQLTVNIRTVGARRYSATRLESLFGQRPATLDAQSIASEQTQEGTLADALLAAAGLLVVAVVLLVVAFSRRGRRKRRKQQLDLMMATLPPEMWDLSGAGPGVGWVAPPAGAPGTAPATAGPAWAGPGGTPAAPAETPVAQLTGWPPDLRPQPPRYAPPPQPPPEQWPGPWPGLPQDQPPA
jgi:hypothetical protein